MNVFRDYTRTAAFPLLLQLAFWSWVVLTLLRPIQSCDVWWQLASGRYIATHHQIPFTDVFSLTCRGNRWIDFEWLYQLLLFASYRIGNLYGVTGLKIALIALALFFLIRRIKQAAIPEIVIFLSALIVFTACAPGWSERADLVSIALVSALMNSLEGMRLGTISMAQRWRWCILFLIWANMHGGGVIIGAGIAGFYGIEYARRGRLSWKQSTFWLFAILATTLMTPYGYHLWIQIIRSLAMVPHADQSEFLPPPWSHVRVFWVALTLQALVFLRDLKTGRDLSWIAWVLTVVFGYEAARHARFVPFFMFAAFPFGIHSIWKALGKGPDRLFQSPFGYLGATAIMSLWAIAQIPRTDIGLRADQVPVAACDFIAANHIGGRFFNDFDFGSYWIWRFAGDPPVFIDGRSSTVEGYVELRQEIRRAQQGPPSGWQRFLDKYAITAVLIPYPAANVPIPVFVSYFPKARWSLVYRDNLALLFLRRDAHSSLSANQA